MAEVKSLSNMMNPGTVLAGGDCETCGKGGDAPKVVTRVAMANIEKLNTPVQKVAAAAPKVEKTVQAAPQVEAAKKPSLLSPNKPEGK